MIDSRFGGLPGHREVLALEPLRKDPSEQLLYLETFLEEYDQTVQEAIRAHGLGDSS